MMTKTLEPVHFLLVDDLEENLLSLEALLRREGLVLLKAKSGYEALELLLKYDVALALLDIQMPVMDGFELAELMRGTERTRGVPIIFLTAGTSDAQRRFKGYEAGAVDFLQKPIEPDVLKSKTSVFFDLYRQRQQIAMQRDELKTYSEALKDADRRKDEFLATLAHELRNPLAPIRNGLQVLRLSNDPKVAEEVRDMMDRQLTHMVRLVDDLLDVSRISKGKIDLRKEPITLQSAISIALEGSKPLIQSLNHKLNLEIPEKNIWVNADLTRLGQVISNLLNNAAKYTPEGGTITLAVSCKGEQASINVTDNGVGISSEMLPKVFELFTQVDNTLERAQGGLGIGLALVQQLVKMHGGEISAKSNGANKGSTFTVTLPLEKAPENTNDNTIPATNQDNAKLRVLVVDDNVASAKTTGWMLELIGHEPMLAHDGLEALNSAKQLNPDVIMLDIGLPGMNGYDVCAELRKQPQFKNTIIIAQTGWGQAKDRQLAKDAGFTHHLTKPVKLEELTQLLSA